MSISRRTFLLAMSVPVWKARLRRTTRRTPNDLYADSY